VSTWTRGVIAFDLATKLTDEDGDTAMDEEESLAQHGFADYTLAEGFLTARRLLRSTKKAPCSLAANRFLVDERPMATAVSIFHGDRVQLTCIQCLFRAAGDGKL
jgi:hypothetical protein